MQRGKFMTSDTTVDLDTMGRELNEAEQRALKKDVMGKTMIGLIVVLVLAVVVFILSFVIPEVIDTVKDTEVHLNRRAVRKTFTFIALGLSGIAVYMVSTLKTAFEALPEIKKAKVVDIDVDFVKDKKNDAYKHYGTIKVSIGGSIKILDVPVIENDAKYVRWKKKGKLYFVPEKFYMLGKVDDVD